MAVEASWGLFDCPSSSCRHDAYRKSSRVFRKQGGDRWGAIGGGVTDTRYRQQAAAHIPISVGRQTSQSFVVRAVPQERGMADKSTV